MNAQTVYKISLAFSDLLVGVFVYPTSVIILIKSLYSDVRSRFFTFVGNYSFSNNVKITNYTKNPYSPFSETLVDKTDEDKQFFNAVGVLQVISVGVSVYTLVAAAGDRFKAIYRPLTYKSATAISTAVKISVAIWISVTIFSTFPLYVEKYTYGIVYPMLVIPIGPWIPFIYAGALCIPILLMWISTIALIVLYKITAKKRRRLSASQIQDREIDKGGLVCTLGIMVGVFTLCLSTTVIIVMLQYLPNFRKIRRFYNTCRVVVAIIFASNSLWNFFIYSARYEDFRKTAKRLYLQLICPGKCEVCNVKT